MSTEQFYVDGNTTERIAGYCVWRVVDNAGNILCSFHGPMSCTAAMVFCEMLRGGTKTPKITGLNDYTRPKKLSAICERCGVDLYSHADCASETGECLGSEV